MNLDVRDYKDFPAEVTLEVEADNAEYAVDVQAFTDVMKIELTIQKVNEEYLCQGEIAVKAEQECSRCLSSFEAELTGELNFIIRMGPGKAVMATDQGADVLIAEPGQPVVELNDLIRQSLSLSIPLKPLCSEECLGICPYCGANRNEEPCNCVDEETDERWEGLKDLYE